VELKPALLTAPPFLSLPSRLSPPSLQPRSSALHRRSPGRIWRPPLRIRGPLGRIRLRPCLPAGWRAVAPAFLSGPAPVSRWLAVPRVAGGRRRRYSPRGGLPGLGWPGARRRRYSPRGGLPGSCAASGRALVRPRGGWGWCSCPGSPGAGAPSAWFLVASGRLASPPLAALSWWPTAAGCQPEDSSVPW